MPNQPIILEDNNSNKINVIWANSLYFQMFQRCVYEQICEKDYLEFIKNESNCTSFIPIYSSDAEIFNFRPGRFKEEAKYLLIDEWQKIKDILLKLESLIEIVSIEKLLKYNTSKFLPTIKYDTIFPILVKKQDKYNIYRWALGGEKN